MKVHIKQIPPEGLHLEGTESNTILDLHERGLSPVDDVRYSIDVGTSEGGLFATGTVGVDFDMDCVVCLEKFRFPAEVTDFACQVELDGRETVDLTEQVREDILLALPAHPHCDWDGRRECPGAPSLEKTRNAADESDSATREVWGALDQLKLK